MVKEGRRLRFVLFDLLMFQDYANVNFVLNFKVFDLVMRNLR